MRLREGSPSRDASIYIHGARLAQLSCGAFYSPERKSANSASTTSKESSGPHVQGYGNREQCYEAGPQREAGSAPSPVRDPGQVILLPLSPSLSLESEDVKNWLLHRDAVRPADR